MSVLAMALFALSMAAAPCVNAQAKQKTRVAVFPFEVTAGVVNSDEAVFIREDFSNRLAQTGLFELVPRTEVDKLFKQEAAFQLNDLSDATKTAEYGRVLNADWIMAGRLGKVGSRLALIVTMYTYPDFVQKPGSQVYAPDIDTLVDNLPTMIATIQAGQGGATASSAATASAAAASAKPAATAAAKTYKIGDKGPAGGNIFYDKGNSNDGWRYLECAPASTEWKGIKWAESGGKVDKTTPGIGAGKENTRLIMARFMTTGEAFRAAQRCDALTYGGYDDWFLPSKLELGLMFMYLKEAGIGGFSEDWYWSSTESGDHNGVWAQKFSDGEQVGNGDAYYYKQGAKSYGHLVRAIRQF
jgi:hypothetical protein